MKLGRLGAALLLVISLLSLPAGAPAAQNCEVGTYEYDAGGPPRSAFPSDPLFPRQWGLDQVKARGAWEQGARGRRAVIAVIDSGVDFRHPDLRRKLLRGLDLAKLCPRPQDEYGHGTAVAGIAAAKTNNRVGIAGVAPRARIMPIRISQGEAGLVDTRLFIERAAKAISYAADRGADVINMSFGSEVFSLLAPEIVAAMQYAADRGVVLVAAAGNESLPVCTYPAADAFAVCVAATNRRGLPAVYSNFPVKPALGAAVRAPGGEAPSSTRALIEQLCESDEGVWTTLWPGSSFECRRTWGYDAVSGTSFAAPHVAGVAALLAGMGLTSNEIVECLKETSFNPLTGGRGRYEPVYGYGIVDAQHATATCVRGPKDDLQPSRPREPKRGASPGPRPPRTSVSRFATVRLGHARFSRTRRTARQSARACDGSGRRSARARSSLALLTKLSRPEKLLPLPEVRRALRSCKGTSRRRPRGAPKRREPRGYVQGVRGIGIASPST